MSGKHFILGKTVFPKDNLFDEYINHLKEDEIYLIGLHEQTGNKLIDADTPPILISIDTNSEQMDNLCDLLNSYYTEIITLQEELKEYEKDTTLKEIKELKDKVKRYEKQEFERNCGRGW